MPLTSRVCPDGPATRLAESRAAAWVPGPSPGPPPRGWSRVPGTSGVPGVHLGPPSPGHPLAAPGLTSAGPGRAQQLPGASGAQAGEGVCPFTSPLVPQRSGRELACGLGSQREMRKILLVKHALHGCARGRTRGSWSGPHGHRAALPCPSPTWLCRSPEPPAARLLVHSRKNHSPSALRVSWPPPR